MNDICVKINVNLATWKGVFLFIMGRVQLIKFLIHGMLTFSFCIYLWPVHMLKQLDKWFRNFIWSGDISTRKVCTVFWATSCLPFTREAWASSHLEVWMTLLFYIFTGRFSVLTMIGKFSVGQGFLGTMFQFLMASSEHHNCFFWIPPNVGWIKVNTYGSSIGNHPMLVVQLVSNAFPWILATMHSKLNF